MDYVSRPVRALWIEMIPRILERFSSLSRPVRALWIEMPSAWVEAHKEEVEAREGLVD